MDKLLTIIIPSYNVSKYLAKGCESLNVSEWRDRIEVLIVNDGSKDNTSDIGHGFERRFPQTYRVIDKTNGNYGSCVNRGLSEASGVFVKVMDGDDYFDSECFKRLLETLDKFESEGSEVDVVLSRVECVGADGKTWKDAPCQDELRVVPMERIFDINDVSAGVYFSMSTITYRRSVFNRFVYRQTERISYSDNEWRIIPMVFVRKVYAIPFRVYLYLMGRDGQTMNPKTFATNLGMIMTITKGLVAKCAEIELKGIPIGAYVRRCVQDQVDMMYLASLCGWKNYSVKLDIKEFDDYMRVCGGGFYHAARNREILYAHFPMSLLSFSPVRVWDRWHTVYAPRLMMHRLLKKAERIVRGVK